MLTLLEELFEALPPHIKDDNDFVKILNIFFDSLKDEYEFSNNSIDSKMVDLLLEKYKESQNTTYYTHRNELIKFHLNELFSTLEKATKDNKFYKRIADTFKNLGIEMKDLNIINNTLNTITQQNINSNKTFNRNKGKLISFLAVYDIVSKANIQGINNGGFLRVIQAVDEVTKKPLALSYKVESSLYKETFEAVVKPLAHPIGFGYVFYTLVEFAFEDYFLVKVIKHLRECIIRCLQPDGTYKETNLLENKIIAFDEVERDDGKKLFWVKYEDKKSKEIVKLVVNYDNTMKLYSLENLKIKSLRLADVNHGILTLNKRNDGSIVSITYNQYFINRRKSTPIYYTIEGDTQNKEYLIQLSYNPDEKKVVENQTYMEPQTYTDSEIFQITGDELHGRLIYEYPRTCGIHYKIEIERQSTIIDELIWESDIDLYDEWYRKFRGNWWADYWVGRAYAKDRKPQEWIPKIGEFYISNSYTQEFDEFIIGESDFTIGKENLYIASSLDNTKNDNISYIGNFIIGGENASINDNKENTNNRNYFVGNAYDPYLVPHNYEPTIGEEGFIIGNDDLYRGNGWVDDNIAEWLPEVNDLGMTAWDWFMRYPRYEVVIDETEVRQNGYEYSPEIAPARDLMYGVVSFDLSYNDSYVNLIYGKENEWNVGNDNSLGSSNLIGRTGSYDNSKIALKPKSWEIGEYTIGNSFSDNEINNYLKNYKKLPNGEIIRFIGTYFDKEVLDGELYPTHEINEQELSFDFGEIEFEDEYNFEIDGSFSFETLGWSRSWKREDLIIGDFTIGNDYADGTLLVGEFNLGDTNSNADALTKNRFTIGNSYEIGRNSENISQTETSVLIGSKNRDELTEILQQKELPHIPGFLEYPAYKIGEKKIGNYFYVGETKEYNRKIQDSLNVGEFVIGEVENNGIVVEKELSQKANYIGYSFSIPQYLEHKTEYVDASP